MVQLHEDLPDQKDKSVIDVFKQKPSQGETPQPVQQSTSEPLLQTPRKRCSAKGALAPPEEATSTTETILRLSISHYLMLQKQGNKPKPK